MTAGKVWKVMAISVLLHPLVARSAEPAGPAAPQERPRPATQPGAVKTFAVLEYRVEGNSMMRPIDIERAVTPYLGEEKSIKDVESARQSLERVYHDYRGGGPRRTGPDHRLALSLAAKHQCHGVAAERRSGSELQPSTAAIVPGESHAGPARHAGAARIHDARSSGRRSQRAGLAAAACDIGSQ